MGFIEFDTEATARKPWDVTKPFNFEILEASEPEEHTSQAGNKGMRFEVTFRYWQEDYGQNGTTWKKFYTTGPGFIMALCESVGMKMKGLSGFETSHLMGKRGEMMMDYLLDKDGEKKKYPNIRDEGAFIYREPLEDEPSSF